MADAIDRVKTSRSDATIIAVGGGSVILADPIPGASEILRPPHHDVANAIGAAIAKVSGSAEEVVTFRPAATPRRCRPSPHEPAPPRWRPEPTPIASRSSTSRRHH